MLRTIKLYGALAKDTGVTTLKLDADTPQMLMNGLKVVLNGFEDSVRNLETPVSILSINTKSKAKDRKVKSYSKQGFTEDLGKNDEVHILPYMGGAGMDPLSWSIMISEGLSVSMATAVTIVSVATSIGQALILGAVASMLAPKPDTSGGSQRPEQKPSFIFNGAQNVQGQGCAVPLCYGTCLTGSVVMSSGYDAVEIT